MNIYVSPDGSDKWSGSFASPTADRQDGPLATIKGARDLIRRGGIPKEGEAVRVWLRGGNYLLSEPIVFIGEDSGSFSEPVVYTAWPGEKPVISGGRIIDDWEIGEINGCVCWIADLPGVKEGKDYFTQLFVNGQRRFRPRLPKTGYFRFAGWDEQYKKQAEFRANDLQLWDNLEDVKIVTLQLWDESHLRIKSIDKKSNTVHFQTAPQRDLIDETGQYSRYFVENIREELTQPGEWYLDRRAGKLYYLPMEDERLEETEVVAPVLQQLVHFAGTEKEPVTHIHLENLAFYHADWEYPIDMTGSGQAAIQVPGVLLFEHTEDCVLYGCEVAHIAQYGIDLRSGCAGNQIIACNLYDLGGGGIRIGDSVRGGKVDRTPRPMNTTVSDCGIYDGSIIFLSAIGVWISNNGYNRVVHNHIHRLNYTGISCGWTWGYGDSATIDNRIEYNHIHHINWQRALSDNGGIYTLGIHPGSTIRGNLIHHVGRYGYGGWGIYPDEGSSEIIIENNLVHTCDGPSFSTHYGRDNQVCNNIFADCGDPQLRPGQLEQHRSTVFMKNIVYWRKGGINLNLKTGHFLFQNNLFWGGSKDLLLGGGMTLESWEALGQHRNSIVADPLFDDVNSDNYNLRIDSPAVSLGFKPFDSSIAGIRNRGWRPAGFDDWKKENFYPKPILQTKLSLTDRKVLVEIENVGIVTASGRLKLRGEPGKNIIFAMPPVFSFSQLEPGCNVKVEFELKKQPEDEEYFIESIPYGAGLVPASILVCPVKSAEIRRIPYLSASELSALPEVMEKVETQNIMWFKQKIAEVRMAITGGFLGIAAKIIDGEIPSGRAISQGGCLQVFIEPINMNKNQIEENRKRKKACHIFLSPAASDEAEDCAYLGRVLEPRIQVFSCRDENGYDIFSLIPLSLAGLSEQDNQFKLELMVDYVPRQSGTLSHVKLFGAPVPWKDSKGYGIIQVEN